jgi:hypothetical protein
MKSKVVKMFILSLAAVALLAGCSSQTGNSTTPGTNTTNTANTETGTETGTGTTDESEAYGNKGALADENLTEEEMLRYAIEDEYAARSEYAAVVEKLGDVNPFANIAVSEQSHIDALKTLYGYRNMEVPADNSASHVVVPATLVEAKNIGAEAEVNNIAMYEKFLNQNLPDDMKRVFTSLKEASEQHLEAFRN